MQLIRYDNLKNSKDPKILYEVHGVLTLDGLGVTHHHLSPHLCSFQEVSEFIFQLLCDGGHQEPWLRWLSNLGMIWSVNPFISMTINNVFVNSCMNYSLSLVCLVEFDLIPVIPINSKGIILQLHIAWVVDNGLGILLGEIFHDQSFLSHPFVIQEKPHPIILKTIFDRDCLTLSPSVDPRILFNHMCLPLKRF